MPHDVIMPALGMAQETGKIVSWLKRPGDPVRLGEPIMEVETDKSTMEVEAQADGFLIRVSAEAGDDVPVGNVIAVIAETPDDMSAPPAGRATPNEQGTQEPKGLPTAPVATTILQGQDIIMPALGMAQDTGLIVAWRKAPGDKVAADDTLLEVETDKSVMEVPAGHDGYIAAILADAQTAVPVGSVIAVITPDKPSAPIQVSAPAPAWEAQAAAPTVPKQAETQARAASSAPPSDQTGRILVSPKARRLAHEEGLDLSMLLASGTKQPFKTADLQTLRELATRAQHVEAIPEAKEPQALPDRTTAPATSALHIMARLSASGCESFITRMKAEGGIDITQDQIWLYFATGTLRRATTAKSRTLVVELRDEAEEKCRYLDADLTRLSKPTVAGDEDMPALIIRDFTASRISLATSVAAETPVLTIGRDNEAFILSFDYRESQLSEVEALAFMTEFAERLADPLQSLI
jgi:pyruvate/2-oxoglutarate dehydrogenase complex dihydrolipoamide acyltransferase (E2) component